MDEGIPIEFLGSSQVGDKEFSELLEMVLEKVKEGKILILDNSLDPEKKKVLIQKSMESVDDDFPGIEFTSLETGDFIDRAVNKVYSFLGRERRRGLTIIGNSEVMEKVQEDKESVSFIAKTVGGGPDAS